ECHDFPHSTVTKTSAERTLFDALSRLTFLKATKLLGPDGNRLIAAGGKYDIDISTQVEFDRDVFRLAVDSATVTLALSPAARGRLKWRCYKCDVPCEHAGAAFSLILEEKLALGLAGAPPERAPDPRQTHHRSAGPAQTHPAARGARPACHGVSRCRRVHSGPAPAATYRRDGRRDPARSESAPTADHPAEGGAPAVPTGRHRLCGWRGARDPGRRYGTRQDHSGHRRGGTARAGSRNPQDTDHLPRL